MPRKPKIACTAKGCPNLVEPGTGGLCEVHRKAKYADYMKQRRDKEATKIYSTKAWQIARTTVLQRDHGWCVMCGEKPADLVDHIVEIKDGGCPFCPENLQSLCHACHAKKTAEVRKQREIVV